MERMSGVYTLSPDITIVPVSNTSILFKADTVSVKLEGSSVELFLNSILPLMDGKNTSADICSKIPGLQVEDLENHLDSLVSEGVCIRTREPRAFQGSPISSSYISQFLNSRGIENSKISTKSNEFRIALVGLHPQSVQTLFSLSACGLKNFKIADSTPCDEDFLLTFPFLRSFSGKHLRQDVVADYLKFASPGSEIELAPHTVTKQKMTEFLADRDLVLVCAADRLGARSYWINQICHEKSIPAIYSSISGHRCLTGPFVIPDRTACYKCARMRQVEAADDVADATAYEDYLSTREGSPQQVENTFPSNLHFVSALICSDVMKFVFELDTPEMINRILEFDSLRFKLITHPVLQKPDCPVCKKKVPEEALLSLSL